MVLQTSSNLGPKIRLIEKLVQRGSPDRRFLWPLDIIDSPSTGTFGYIMPLRPTDYKSIVDMMTRRAEPTFKLYVLLALI